MAKADGLTEEEVAAVRAVLEERAQVVAAIEEHESRGPHVEVATPGRVVAFRHVLLGITVPAVVVATVESLEDGDEDTLRVLNIPDVPIDADEDRAVLAVFIPRVAGALRDGTPTAEVQLVSWAKRSDEPLPGTWDWPVRR